MGPSHRAMSWDRPGLIPGGPALGRRQGRASTPGSPLPALGGQGPAPTRWLYSSPCSGPLRRDGSRRARSGWAITPATPLPPRPERAGLTAPRPVYPEPGPARSVPQRAFITTLDQGVSSVSNFAVGVAVARLSGIAGLGAFSLAYAAWLLVAALHRALVTDPMAILGDARHPTDTRANLKKGFAAEVTLGVTAGAVIAVLGGALMLAGQRSFGISQLAVAPWVTFLLLQDYWRWIGFMQAKPGKALANDVVFDVVQAAGFVVLLVSHVHSTPLAIAAWGLGALGGAVFGIWQFRVTPSLSNGVQWVKAKWPISRWLAATSTSGWGFTQVYGVLTAAVLGPAALGGLKAAQNLVSGPTLVLVMAGGSLGLPEASRAYDKHGWPGLNRVARFVTAAGLASVGLVFVVVVLFGRDLLSILYGHQFASYAPVAYAMAVAYVFSAGSLGATMRLKVRKKTRLLFLVTLWGLLVSSVGVLALAPAFGVVGVAVGYAVGTGIYAASVILAARWAARREQLAGTADDVPAPVPLSVAAQRP